MTSSSTNWWWFPPVMLFVALAAIGLVSLVENRRMVRAWWRETSYRANVWLDRLYQVDRPWCSPEDFAPQTSKYPRLTTGCVRLVAEPRRPYNWNLDGDGWPEAG